MRQNFLEDIKKKQKPKNIISLNIAYILISNVCLHCLHTYDSYVNLSLFKIESFNTLKYIWKISLCTNKMMYDLKISI